MSVTDHRRRRLGIAAGTALLTLAVTGCSGLGRTAVGPVSYGPGKDRQHQVIRIPVKGCHQLRAPGAVEITNRTLVDVVMYPTDNCSGKDSTYVATTLTGTIANGSPLWRSYRVIH